MIEELSFLNTSVILLILSFLTQSNKSEIKGVKDILLEMSFASNVSLHCLSFEDEDLKT